MYSAVGLDVLRRHTTTLHEVCGVDSWLSCHIYPTSHELTKIGGTQQQAGHTMAAAPAAMGVDMDVPENPANLQL